MEHHVERSGLTDDMPIGENGPLATTTPFRGWSKTPRWALNVQTVVVGIVRQPQHPPAQVLASQTQLQLGMVRKTHVEMTMHCQERRCQLEKDIDFMTFFKSGPAMPFFVRVERHSSDEKKVDVITDDVVGRPPRPAASSKWLIVFLRVFFKGAERPKSLV